MLDVAEAIAYVYRVRDPKERYDEDQYLAACEALVAQRDQMTQHVYIQLPGGMTGNNDSRWDGIKAGSIEKCGCGNERLIVPSNPRTTFEPAAAGPTIVSGANKGYMRPIGGHKTSAYLELSITKDALKVLPEPFSSALDFTMILQGPPAYSLAKLAEAIANRKDRLLFREPATNMPIGELVAVDPIALSATFLPDKDVEVFDPDAEEESHQH